jgi:hypothetical protein
MWYEMKYVCYSRCPIGRNNHTTTIQNCVSAKGWCECDVHDTHVQVNAAITTAQPGNASDALVGVQSSVLSTLTNDNVNDLVSALAARSVDNGGLPINLPQSRPVHSLSI